MGIFVPGPDEGCRFCYPDLLRDKPVFRDGRIVVVRSLDPDTMQPLPGQYTLFVPGHHSRTWAQLPNDLAERVRIGLATIPEFAVCSSRISYPAHTLYLNVGKLAGQTMEHLHVNVQIIDPASPSADMGPALVRRRYAEAVGQLAAANEERGAMRAAMRTAVQVALLALESGRLEDAQAALRRLGSLPHPKPSK